MTKGIGRERGLFLVGAVVVGYLVVSSLVLAWFWPRLKHRGDVARLVAGTGAERFAGDTTPPIFPPEDTVAAATQSRRDDLVYGASAGANEDGADDDDIVEPFQACYLNGSGSIGQATGGAPDPARVPKQATPAPTPVPRTAAPAPRAATVAAEPEYESPYAKLPGAVAAMMETPGAANTNDGRGAWRPCEVYFTDNMKICDANEFRYHPIYYEKKLADVRKAVAARGGTPTVEQNDLILRYTRILADYSRFPQNQHCKLSLPNWKVRVDEPDAPFISKNLHNAERGSPSHWAFCWRANDDPDRIQETGMIVQSAAGGSGRPDGADFDGVYHVRGTFDEDISRDGVVQTYCTESAETVDAYKIKSAIVIEDAPGARRIRFYKNDAPTELTEADVNRYFRDQLFRMALDEVRRGNQRVGRAVARPQVRTFRLVKLAKDPCDRTVEHYASTATVEFGSEIELATTVLGQGNDYLHGLIPTLETRIGEHDTLIQQLQDAIDELVKQRKAKRDRLEQLKADMKKALADRDRARKKLDECLKNPYEKIGGVWRRVDIVGMMGELYAYVHPKTGVAYTRRNMYGPNLEILGQFLLNPTNRNEMTMRLKYIGGGYFSKSVDFFRAGKLLTVNVNPNISLARPSELSGYSAGARGIQAYLRTRGTKIPLSAVR